MMRKSYLLIFLAFALFSCNNDEELTTIDNSALLQKVIFYRNSTNEKHWNFNNRGLLDKITEPDGTLIETFEYDSNNNVTKDTKYNNGVVSMTYNITYNSNNFITEINSTDYNYDATANKYTYSNSSQTFSCQLNESKLATNYSLIEINPSGNTEINYLMNYTSGNMNSFEKINNGVVAEFKEFTYSSTTIGGNPLLNATLPVLRVKSLVEPDFFSNAISSKLPIETVSFGSTNPEIQNYGWLVNKDGRLSMQSIEIFNSGSLVDSYIYADYYYSN